jgi:predicted RNA-binding protein with EMAP domain
MKKIKLTEQEIRKMYEDKKTWRVWFLSRFEEDIRKMKDKDQCEFINVVGREKIEQIDFNSLMIDGIIGIHTYNVIADIQEIDMVQELLNDTPEHIKIIR